VGLNPTDAQIEELLAEVRLTFETLFRLGCVSAFQPKLSSAFQPKLSIERSGEDLFVL
jgi:hypothetical protein